MSPAPLERLSEHLTKRRLFKSRERREALSPPCRRSWRQSTNPPPLAIHARREAPAPGERPAL